MISGLSHVSIVVPDLDAAAQRLRDVYGLVIGAAKINEEQAVRIAYVELGNACTSSWNPHAPIHP